MAALNCPCGHVHDLAPNPDDAWLTLPDRDYDELQAEIVRFHTEPRPAEIQVEFGRIYECPGCGRVMWCKPGEYRYRVFRRDED